MVEIYFTVPEIAERLRVTPDTVRRWLRTGRLRGILPGGRKAGYRVSAAELERFIAKARRNGAIDS